MERSQELADALEALRTGEVVEDEEVTVVRTDGSAGAMRISSAPIYSPSGEITAAVRVFYDISERKEMETLLLKRNAELLQTRAELEQRVRERTAELAASAEELAIANEELEQANRRLADTNRQLQRVNLALQDSNKKLEGEIAVRQRIEQELRESEALQRQMLEILPVGVGRVSAEGVIQEANQAGLQIWEGAHYVGLERYSEYRAWWAATGELIQPQDWAAARAVTRGEVSIDEELEIECFDGSHKFILNSSLPLRDEQGRISGAIIVNQDITEWKRAERQLMERSQELADALEALRTSEERLRTVINTAPLALWAVDRDGMYTLLEGQALASQGLRPGDRIGTSIYSLIRNRPVFLEALSLALDGEEISGVRSPSADGKSVFETHFSPRFDATGRSDGVIGVSTDITEQVHAEEALRNAYRLLEQANVELEVHVSERTSELEEARLELEYELAERERAEVTLQAYALQLERSNRDLQDFTTIASHDLQEPLRKIQAFGDRLLSKTGDRLEAHERDYLERMVLSAARLSDLIRDLLVYSRLETRTRPEAPVDLREAAVEAISDLEETLAHTGGQVEVGPLPVIEADPVQMRRLFQNLFSNGLKFHREGVKPVVKVYMKGIGEGSISTMPLSPEGKLTEAVAIIVEDNGIGFEQGYAERIFQPFQRLVGRSEVEGSGMGLTICRKIVERHGGQIHAIGRPGHGATFIVRLPSQQRG